MSASDLLNPVAVPGHNQPPVDELVREEHADLFSRVQDLADRANAAKNALTVADDGKTPLITTEEEFAEIAAIGREAAKLAKEVETTKLETTKPLRERVAEINAVFALLRDRPDRIASILGKITSTYTDMKRAAERRRQAEEAQRLREEADRKAREAEAARGSIVADVDRLEAKIADHKAQVAEAKALDAGKGPIHAGDVTVSQRTTWDFRITNAGAIDLNKLRPHFSIADIEKALRGYVRANHDTAPLAGVEFFATTTTQFRG